MIKYQCLKMQFDTSPATTLWSEGISSHHQSHLTAATIGSACERSRCFGLDAGSAGGYANAVRDCGAGKED
jgi:hypothetical protein